MSSKDWIAELFATEFAIIQAIIKQSFFAIGSVLQMCDTITTLFGMSLNDKKEIKWNFNGFFLFARVHGKENSFWCYRLH